MDTNEKFIHIEPDHAPRGVPEYQVSTPSLSSPQPQYQQYQQPSPQLQPQQIQPMEGQPPMAAYAHPQQQQQQQQHPQQQPQQQQFQAQPMVIDPSAYGQQGGKWQADLCDCSPCSSCLLAWCLPCLLLGQTSERIRDPSMQTADMLNSDCMIHGLINCFTGCGWIYGMLKRGEIRERYQIEGSGCDDCCVSYWCPCCALQQQDNEVKLRQRSNARQPVAQPYQTQPAMQVPAPPPPPPTTTYG
ncbi:hypothetical protein M426DRAFT_324917 [Hypoxylon sp. CI-4A]|nr:hypothetical protein M426DRAFT_324917 [Hypoxylon sp. CI-4A]